MKKILSVLLVVVMVLAIFAGCTQKPATPDTTPADTKPAETKPAETKPVATEPDVTGDTDGKEAPILAEQVAAGTLPALADRLPVASDIYVEVDNPAENPVYGGTIRTQNNGKWYFGPVTEEPMFRLVDDGSVVPNVAKSWEVSDDGLLYTVHLREGMRWSDGEPFTATDVVYYYNYILVTDVDNETGKVINSATTCYYNWYNTTDPETGFLRPAQVRYVDDTTFTIKLYSPKPNLLQAICIDNKWLAAPKHWYKDIQAFDSSKPHWSGESDLKLVGGEGLTDLTEAQALENAKNRSSLYTFEDYNMLCMELCYYYWQYAGRPTLRPWVMTTALTETNLLFERNPYFWKVDTEGRQLPYIDAVEFVGMDRGLIAQEVIAGHLDFQSFTNDELTSYMAGSTIGTFDVKLWNATDWTSWGIHLNQTYKDEQYTELFANIDFRHALSIAVDRDDMNNILFNGLSTPAQAVPQPGTAEYQGGEDKWVEMNVEEANALLDGIDSITKEFNSDGLRTFVSGPNAGKPITLGIETCGNEVDSKTVALLNQYYHAIGIQAVEVPNTDNNARDEKLMTGTEAMVKLAGLGTFGTKLRPDAVAANRRQVAWVGKYGLEHMDHYTPEPGSPMEEVVEATKALIASTTAEQLDDAARRIVASHVENTWVIGFVVDNSRYMAINSRVHNFPDGLTWGDELRFFGYGKPYTWFIQE